MSGLALLEDPAVLKQVHRFTIEEYHRLGERGEIGERTELIEGLIINKMPKSPLYRYLMESIFERLRGIFPDFFSLVKSSPSLSKLSNRSQSQMFLSFVVEGKIFLRAIRRRQNSSSR
jgi:hypothetical protein